MSVIPPDERVIVALDTPNVADARAIVDRIGDATAFYKVGLELMFDGGLDYAVELARSGKRVFLDMKLLDIGNTVERAVANLASRGLTFLTIHGQDTKTLRAAVKGREGSSLKLLAVTVLTNIDADDLSEQGITTMRPADLVVHRARIAHEAGIDGVVASPHEAAAIRKAVGSELLIVTPGIRPAGSDLGDQVRAATPAAAISAGADHLVVGRPVTRAPDPRAAVLAIRAEIENRYR
jgi:orotidine-5'-phosphate decarboxylase